MGTSPKTGEEYGSGIVFWFNFLFLNRPMGTSPKTGEEYGGSIVLGINFSFLNRPMGTSPKTGEEYGKQKDFFDPNSQNLTF